jgi:hypothetical protein
LLAGVVEQIMVLVVQQRFANEQVLFQENFGGFHGWKSWLEAKSDAKLRAAVIRGGKRGGPA